MKFFRKNKPIKILLIVLFVILSAAFIFFAKLQFAFLSEYFFSDLRSSSELDFSDLSEKRSGEIIKEYLLLNENGKRDFFSKLFCKRKFTANGVIHIVFDNRSEFFCTQGNSPSIGGSVYIWNYVNDSVIIKRAADEGFAPFSASEVWRLNTNGFNYIFKNGNILIFDRFDGEDESLMILEY